MGQPHRIPPWCDDHRRPHVDPSRAAGPIRQVLQGVRLHRVGRAVVLGCPDRIEAERLDQLSHVEGVIHVLGIRNRRRAVVVPLHQALPVALVVPRDHHPAVHSCAPPPEVVSPVLGPTYRTSKNFEAHFDARSQVLSSESHAGFPPESAVGPVHSYPLKYLHVDSPHDPWRSLVGDVRAAAVYFPLWPLKCRLKCLDVPLFYCPLRPFRV